MYLNGNDSRQYTVGRMVQHCDDARTRCSLEQQSLYQPATRRRQRRRAARSPFGCACAASMGPSHAAVRASLYVLASVGAAPPARAGRSSKAVRACPPGGARAPHAYLKTPRHPWPTMHARGRGFCKKRDLAAGLGVMLVGKGRPAGERGGPSPS
eukprot:COSAG02_NODE_11399_length_1731_cov_1.537990_2_plen_154_part_01